MAEARGLSRAILQAPDIIGEQRQVDALRGQQALQREKLAASQAPKPFDVSKYNFGGLKYGMDVADDPIYKQFEEKIFEVVRNQGPDAARVLANRFQNQYNNLKDTVGQNLKSSFDIREDLDPERYSALGFAGLLADQQYISDNVVVDDQFNIMLRDEDGQLIPLISHPSIQDPQSYYRKPADYLAEGVDAMQLAYRKIEDGDITTQSLDVPKMREQANLYMQTKVKNEPDLLNNTVNRYLTEELGIPANKSVGDAILAEGEYRYTDANGNPAVITQEDVLSWGANNIFESTRPRASFTQTQDEERSGGKDAYEKAVNSVRPISEDHRPFDDPKSKKAFTVRAGIVVPDNTDITLPNGTNAKIISIYDQVGGGTNTLSANISFKDEDGDIQYQRIKLGPQQIAEIETDLGIPQNKKLSDLVNDVKPKDNERLGGRDTQAEETEETEESYTFDGETYTLSELKQKYGEDFNPLNYEGFELKK